MIARHPSRPVSFFCFIWGYTRIHYYQSLRKSKSKQTVRTRIVSFVKEQRGTAESAKVGTAKIHYLMNQSPAMADIKVGRDQLYAIMKEEGLTLRQKRRKGPQLTNGNGESIYKDYRKQLHLESINELWCCDITYFYIGKDRTNAYLTIVQDEKSHKIVGYHLSSYQDAESVLEALKKAIKVEFPKGRSTCTPLYFHTDRGGVFKGDLFMQTFKTNDITPSMCAAGKSYENPVAERVNGILKNEILQTDQFETMEAAQVAIDRAIEYYNNVRPHLSNEMLTPSLAHQYGLGPLKNLWRQRKKRRTKQNTDE